MLFFTLATSGQCSLQISCADTCHLGTITANLISNLKATEYVWKQGDSIIQINTSWKPAGVKIDVHHYQGFYYQPYGLAFDTAHNLYVADEDNQVVQRYAPGSNTGVTVAGGNGFGSDANQLWSSTGIAVDKAGNIYIAELINYRVSKWAPGATSGVTVAGGNDYGDGANQFKAPADVAVDDSGNVYVSDFEGSRVQKWAPGAVSGVTVAGGNGSGSAPNQLSYPLGIFIDSARNIYVADSYNNRIQKWAPGAASGVTVAGGNGPGNSVDQLNHPQAVTVTKDGLMFIADGSNYRILRWKEGKHFGTTVAGGYGFNDDQFYSPAGIVTDNDNQQALYVSDGRNGNGRVSKFTLTNTVSNTFNPITTGSYTATVKTRTGCTAASINPIVINTMPFPHYLNGPRNYHAGDVLTYVTDSSVGLHNNYVWTVPSDASIVSGQGTPAIQVKFGSSFSGYITVQASNSCGTGGTLTKKVFIINRASTSSANLMAEKNTADNYISLAPNPAHTTTTVTFSASRTGTYTMQISDAAGRKLKQIKGLANAGINHLPIDVTGISTGVYFINVNIDGITRILRLNVQQ